MSGVDASFSINDIELIDTFSKFETVRYIFYLFLFAARRHTHLQPLLLHQYPNKTLIYYGYIGCAPMYPSVAISLCTLSAYRQSHRTCPRFSIQSQCKTLCYLHDVPYRPYLRTQFSAAYDTFLEIIHRVKQRLRGTLKQDTVNWCLLNSCPAGCYKLDDEPALDFEWLVSIDGNNSLKRWDSTIYGTTAQSDSCNARSDYWIHVTAVDKFKDEVKSRQVSVCYLYNYVLTLSFRQTQRVMMTGRTSPQTQIFQEHSCV
ncbi:hypothetical protein DEU56DRAFT_729540 [Suillus clintonianus]|uniref:uncharacterized protein n=1 Tax=Suillus clintonianus TaxID=1904413 RepID=UPI001B87F17F|nr:uncharacterized protein DEU56DRAFT_729540 [Suillus clintonianus]KAG2149218.1 hypothetical protein DEU56DRAFT_729540 [Suillus clintonianus]